MDKTENMAAMLLALTKSDEWFRLCDSDEGIRVANAMCDVSAQSLSLTMQALRESRIKART